MAQVNFVISAIDKTRAAFASINQSLNRMVRGGDMAQRRMMSLGARMLGIGSIAMLLGSQVRKVAQDIESVPGVNRETIDSWEQLRARMSAANGVLGNIVASAGHGLNSLANLIRFGWIAALDGVDAAQADVIENERKLREEFKINSGWYDKLHAANDRLMRARVALQRVGETDGQSIARRRQEVALMEQKAAGISDEIKRTEALAKAAELRATTERDFHKLRQEEIKLTREAGIANGKMTGSMLPLKERIAGLTEEWVKLSAQLATYNDLSNPEILERRNEVLKQMAGTADQLTKAYDEQNRIAADAARVITGGFEDAIFAGEGLRGMIRGIGQDLARYIFQQTITKSLGGSIAGGISSLLGFRAAGGPVSASSPYIVGENGPELFTPSQAGRIIPNHSLESTAGSAGQNITVHFAPQFSTGVTRQEVAALLPRMVEAAKGAVAEAVGRGGAYKRSFA